MTKFCNQCQILSSIIKQSEYFFKINSTLYCTVLFFTLALHHHQSKSIIKMKLKAILICLLVWYTGTQAQTSVPPTNPMVLGTINGKVIDKKNNEPLPYASVTIKEDGKVITGAMTKDNGSFTVSNLPIKTLHVEIVFMGYQKYETDVTLTSEDNSINLKSIALEEEAKQLNEVSVVREKSSVEQKIDRKVITVGKDLLSAGSTAAELMNNIPSVSVDQQNNTVSLRGNENVRIFIDGKPFFGEDPSIALKNLPAEVISKIQIYDRMSDQSAFTGFDDGQSSKAINIITKPEFRNGTNDRLFSGYGTDDRYIVNGNINYRKEQRQITLIGLTNNINQQNFSSQDLTGLSSGSGRGPGGPGGPGGGGGGSKGVPGPIAGAGLPFLLLAGGYVLVRRYRTRHTAG